ncbi:hypothetical protein C0V75_15525 [Tabrizicola sp. TH137]|uniref:type III secretion system chaperone n=1 Tax=Tabrizicola sp. TH137 TaxID=2067452 RepID=UPI000C7AFECB|nr:type III secretion system chaperone [Tabrizicola sp. TH137]PLL11438.1 hypothetical protein C0V75_15525 [Tabrizicola sp. TH137]
MTEAQHRPKWLDDMIAELGAEIGLDDLGFGDAGLFELSFDGTEIAVFDAGEAGGIVLKSALSLPQPLPQNALFLLHEANLSTFQSGRGFVTLDLEFGCWVWTDRIDRAQLTLPHLRARLEAGAMAARDCAARLPHLLSGSAAPTAPEAAPDPPGTDLLFRL